MNSIDVRRLQALPHRLGACGAQLRHDALPQAALPPRRLVRRDGQLLLLGLNDAGGDGRHGGKVYDGLRIRPDGCGNAPRNAA